MEYIIGNLLEATTQALVNTVNTVGVMGKGIALQFKENFPHNYEIYAAACQRKEVEIGKMLVVKENTIKGEKLIINFPTKTEWYRKSQYKFIEEGLIDLVRVIHEYGIKSISIPPLGTGNGGLKWEKVKELMDRYLGTLANVDIFIYQPNDAVKKVLQKESKRTTELKPGRAMLLYALFKYERMGEVASLFAANKLAYFLQRSGEELRLDFVAYHYGPYAKAVEKVLYSMNGSYLSGPEQMKLKPFEPLQLNYERLPEIEEYVAKNLTPAQQRRLDDLFVIIEGFESTLSLEILASTDFILAKEGKMEEDQLLAKIQSWNKRKKDLISGEYITIALEHLTDYQQKLNIS
jgi:O-acetyl-ADP-ribose deacetylase (regulator of RNase III)